jgi:hypothetical protein
VVQDDHPNEECETYQIATRGYRHQRYWKRAKETQDRGGASLLPVEMSTKKQEKKTSDSNVTLLSWN